jgi:polyhydroxyalkanoate synthesis repressor PhaR
MPYTIKRYSNRKLYDPQRSRYVTLEDLQQLIREGTEVRVEDAISGEDLTAITLMHVLLEAERTRQAAVPPLLLHQLIKHGEAWYDLLQRTFRRSLSTQLPATPRDVERVWREWAPLAGWPVERPPESGSEPAATRPGLEDDVAALKEQVRALHEQLSHRPLARRRHRAPRRRRRR